MAQGVAFARGHCARGEEDLRVLVVLVACAALVGSDLEDVLYQAVLQELAALAGDLVIRVVELRPKLHTLRRSGEGKAREM